MLDVLLICSMGASTGALCSKIKQVADSESFELNIWAVAMGTSGDDIPKADVILLGPQVRFMQKKIQKEAGNTPVEAIDMITYGKMDAEAVFAQIKKMKESLR